MPIFPHLIIIVIIIIVIVTLGVWNYTWFTTCGLEVVVADQYSDLKIYFICR